MSYDLIFAFSFVLSVAGFTWFAVIRDTDNLSIIGYWINIILSWTCFILSVIIFVKAIVKEYEIGYKKGLSYCEVIRDI